MCRQLHSLALVCLLLIISACKTVTYHADTEVQYLETNSFYPADKNIEKLIAPYSAQLSDKMDVSLGQLEEDLVKDRPNSNLGNWFTDTLLEEANGMFFKACDIAMQNYGGLRVPSLGKGELTVRDIYELMPFDNTVVAIDIPGTVLQQLLDQNAQSNGWPISHTLNYKIKHRKATEVTIHGEPIDNNKIYRLVVPDYVANGGDASGILKSYPQEDSGVFVRDAIIEHLLQLQAENKAIEVDNSKRIFR